MRLRIAAACLACGLAAGAQANGVYRWTDRDGVVHYDDVTSSAQQMTRDILDKRRIDEAQGWEGVVPGEFVAQVTLSCTTWRDRLDNYRSASQLYGRAPTGEVYRMSPNQAHLMIADAERQTQYWCRDGAARKIYAERQAKAR